tara:strand:- start:84 stop:926 length:843 start_codon:yes stop_codon:yes gene_type:complete
VKKTITSIIQFFLSIVFIYLTFSKIELDSLVTILKESNLLLFSLSPILYFISQIISSERLRNLLKVNGFKLSFMENGKLYLIGMFYNFFIPGGIGGDLYKTFFLKKFYNWKVKQTISIIIQDRLIGLGVLLMLIIFLENGLILNINYSIKFLSIFIIYFTGLNLVKLIFRDNKGYSKTFILSIIVHLFQFLSIISIIFALGINTYILEILSVFIISSILSIFSFGGIGIREYVFFSAASTLSLSSELSTSIGLLFTISAAVSSLPGLYYNIKKTRTHSGF